MIRPIEKDPFFLRRKSRPATAEDLSIVRELLSPDNGALRFAAK